MIVAKATVSPPSSATSLSTSGPRATPLVTGLFILLLAIQVRPAESLTFSSGEYIKLVDHPEGTLTSQNYPANYPDYANDIWLLEATPGNVVVLTTSPVAGDTGGSAEVGYENITGCKDYLEVREGNRQGDVYFHACNSNETVTITSVNRWLWVRFVSNDNMTNTGFTASFSQNVTTATQSAQSPIADCQTIRWRCRNMECISYSYRCDRDNDCGCIGPGCDEQDCGGIDWPESTKIAVGTGIGTGIFCLVFFGVGALDLWLKRRQEKENARIQELENSRGRRRPKAPAISMTVPSPAPPGSKNNSSPLATVKEDGEKPPPEVNTKCEEHPV